jgi:hypothetical protein
MKNARLAHKFHLPMLVDGTVSSCAVFISLRPGDSQHMWSFLMNMTLLEIAAVVIVLSVVGTVVVRAFASSRTDGIDAFMSRGMADDRERN